LERVWIRPLRRAGLFRLAYPISLALVGKNLAAGIFVFLEMLAVTAACLLLRMQPSP